MEDNTTRMTYRERREARAARREQWAESREAKAASSFAKAAAIADNIPFGQPILVGHHSERGHRRDQQRIETGMFQGVDHLKMAKHHERAAETIRQQLDRSIYSDDHDAIEKLEERIAGLEAEREAIKAFNAAVRKVKGDTAAIAALVLALPDALRESWETCAKYASYQMNGGQFPSYATSNLSGNIKRNRDRLEKLRPIAEQRERVRQVLAAEATE